MPANNGERLENNLQMVGFQITEVFEDTRGEVGNGTDFMLGDGGILETQTSLIYDTIFENNPTVNEEFPDPIG